LARKSCRRKGEGRAEGGKVDGSYENQINQQTSLSDLDRAIPHRTYYRKYGEEQQSQS